MVDLTHLKDKTVFITGASRGIGEATARLFARSGAHVTLAARSESAILGIAEALRANGSKATAMALDIADQKAVENAINSIEEGVDILVNNAGLIDPIARIDESVPAAWANIIDVNLKGPYYATRAVLPKMMEKGAGTIINISSGAATGALEGWSHYCTSKAALLSLTKCTDKEYRAHGVRVIGLSPGTVATQMQVQIKASEVNPVSQLDPSVHISPDWVAKAIGYICGPGGDAFLGKDFSLKTDEGRAAIGMA